MKKLRFFPFVALTILFSFLLASQALAVTLNPGDIIVADRSAFGGSGGIIRVNPVTGIQTTISSGGLFVDPAGVAIDAAGNIIVADYAVYWGGLEAS